MNSDVIMTLHVAATSVMVGVIWFVQIIHYPWFHHVPSGQFIAYHQQYTHRVGLIVGPAMLIELITGLLLWQLHTFDHPVWFHISLLLLGIIWLSTMCLQIPCHQRLGLGYDAHVHRRLVQTNWIRTIGWSARLAFVVAATMS